jgi:thioredoxin reductase
MATELTVIGAGPGGLAAALEASRAGVRVALVDENAVLGGQYLSSSGPAGKSLRARADERRGRVLMRDLGEMNQDIRTETLVFGMEGQRLALHGARGFEWIETSCVLIATGARELVIPFPGWTLPGVMTLGAALKMVEANGVLPGKRILIAGSGPLVLRTAAIMACSGAQVVTVLEATHPWEWPSHAAAVRGHWDRLREGMDYLRCLRRKGIPYRFGRTVIRALGTDEIQGAVTSRLDGKGNPIKGTEETWDVDTICLGFGFVPNIEVTQLAGCVHVFDQRLGGWVPEVSERMETSIPGVYAVGETTGVAGAAAAMVEGRIAGLAAAQRLGYDMGQELTDELAVLRRQRRRLLRFGEMLNTLFRPRPGLYDITTDDTVICRCEEVPAGEVLGALRRGARHLDALKIWTRAGQGPCQGRTCGPLLARFASQRAKCSEADFGTFGVRPPVKPIPMGSLVTGGMP